MSAIFSDPPFRRGTTLLSGEAIDVDLSGAPIAGREIVGSVKAFQDVVPTGRGERKSNRLVYCVAARYKGSAVDDASTVAGTAYAFDAAASLSEFTSAASVANVNAGLAVGVLDEYLTGKLRQNDIVWLVIKGPTTVKATGAISAGGMVVQSATAGTAAAVGTASASTVTIGQAISAAASNLCRINKTSDLI